MDDHGHPLRFGVFITPSAADAERVVDLAGLADRAGLDLVTFQDHPYQSRFLDTWTLLSFVAARTERAAIKRQRPEPAPAPAAGDRAGGRQPWTSSPAAGPSSGPPLPARGQPPTTRR